MARPPKSLSTRHPRATRNLSPDRLRVAAMMGRHPHRAGVARSRFAFAPYSAATATTSARSAADTEARSNFLAAAAMRVSA